MRTVNSIKINAPLDKVFRLAADVERWPEILPHYRWITTIRRDDDTHVVEMAARRGIIPVKWVGAQRLSDDGSKIYYEHVGGLTTGMRVEWNFAIDPDGVQVNILHDLDMTGRIVGSRLGKWVVGHVFVMNIADKTLSHIKTIAERNGNGE